MLPTYIEDEDVSEKVGQNDQTHSGSMPSNMANEERQMIDSYNNDFNEEEKIFENENSNKYHDKRLRDYPGRTTPLVLDCVINQRRQLVHHAGGQNETSVEVLKLDASEFRSNYDMTKSNLQTLLSEELLGSDSVQARQNHQHRNN